jgi:O-antigen/teichoic acid export membrane protein
MSADSLYRRLVKGSGLVFVGLVFELGFSFLSQLVIARFFGRVDYGAISLGVTVLGFATTIALLGMNKGIGRNLPMFEKPSERRGVLVSAFQISLPLGGLIGAGIFFSAPLLATRVFGDASVTNVIRIFGATVPIAVVMRLIIGAVQGIQLSRAKVIVRNIVMPTTRLAGVVVVLLFGFGVLGLAVAYALAFVVAAVVGLYFVYRYTSLFDDTRPEGMHRTLLAFSAPLVVSATMTKVLSDIDTALLGVYATTGDIGVYNVVYPLAALMSIPMNALGFLFLPIISELYAEDEIGEMARMYQVVAKWTVLATMPLLFGMVLFPESVIAVTFGPGYLDGGLALTVLSVGFFLPLVAGPNSNVLVSVGATKYIMYVDTATALLNVALNVVLIPRYSFLGAAAATAASYLFMNVLYSVQVYRETSAHPLTRSMVVPSAVSAVYATGVYLFVSLLVTVTPVVAILAGVVITAGHGAIVLAFGGVEEEEVMLVLSFEERFGIDLGPFKRVANWLIR